MIPIVIRNHLIHMAVLPFVSNAIFDFFGTLPKGTAVLTYVLNFINHNHESSKERETAKASKL